MEFVDFIFLNFKIFFIIKIAIKGTMAHSFVTSFDSLD